MSNVKKQLGKNIKNIRKLRGMTQECLAEIVGIVVPNISYIECGKLAPSVETFEKIANALGVEPFELYRFNLKSNEEIKKELFCALEGDEKLLKLIYEYFLSIKFLI